MGVDAGSVQSELVLDMSKFTAGLEAAQSKMVNFESKIKDSAKKIDDAMGNVDKRYKVWAEGESGFAVALQGKGKQVEDIKEKMSLLDNEIQKNTESLHKAQEQYGVDSKEAKAYSDEILDLKAKHAGLTKELDKFSLGNQIKDIGSKMSSFGKSMSTYVTLPIVGMGVAAVKTAGDFQAQMSKVSAISGATGSDLQALTNEAMKLGADTSFSSKEAAEGMENLASAGFSVNEIMDAMPGMLDLAASGDLSIADASDIASSALRGFGLQASDSTHVADVFAKAAADTNADVTDMGMAMKYIAPVAHSMGISIEGASAAVGEMANAGIKGEQAGTTLRSALTSLAKPSKDAADLMSQIGFNAFDSKGKMLPLDQMIGRLQKSMKGMTQEQKANVLTTLFGQEALSGMMVLVDGGSAKLKDLTDSLKSSDGSAKAMAKTMQDNLNGSIEQLGGSIETAAIKFGNALIPSIKKATDWLTTVTNKFSELNPKTQETIVKVGLIVASIGPLLLVGGKLASGVGSIINLIGMFTPAAAGAAAATTTAATATTGLGAAASTALVPMLPWIAAIGAAAAAGILLYKYFSSSAIPAVKLFGKETSDSTKKAVTAYMDLNDKATKSLMNLEFSSKKVSKDTADSLAKTFDDMGTQIKTGFDKHFNDDYTKMQSFFDKSSALSSKEEQKILTNMKKDNDDKKKVVDDGTKQIQQILQKASAQHRSLSANEEADINKIEQKMKTDAVKSLSDTELESKSILERMKVQASNLTAQQAAEVAKNSIDQKNKATQAANDQYNAVVKEIIKQRDETHKISADQASKLIKDAQDQKDETVRQATDTCDMVIFQAKRQSKGHVNEVNWETGQVKSKWLIAVDTYKQSWVDMFNDLKSGADKIKNKTVSTWKDIQDNTKKHNDLLEGIVFTGLDNIKSHWGKDFDLLNFITNGKFGTINKTVQSKMNNIYNTVASWRKDIQDAWNKIWNFKMPHINMPHFSISGSFSLIPPKVPSIDTKWYDKGGIFNSPTIIGVGEKRPEFVGALDDLRNIIREENNTGKGNITQNITINSPTPLNPSETARKTLQASRQLAIEWGL